MTKQFSTVQAAVDAIRLGKVVIVVDAEDRENEGDYICAAQTVTTETINFMLRGRGQLCAPILPSTSERLELRPIVQDNTAPLQTAFMTPVDYFGSKTGITAAERAETIRRLASDTSLPSDFVRPWSRLSTSSDGGWRFASRWSIPKRLSIWRAWLD